MTEFRYMKISNRVIVLAGVLGLLAGAAVPALAQMGPWQNADANKDGVIDQAEFDAGRAAHFKEIDGNGDGFLTDEEFKAFFEAQRAKMGERHDDMAAKMMKRLDKNSDGKLNAEEWPAKGRTNFADADGDKDGFVTAEEFAKLRPEGKGPDGKGPDGKGPDDKGQHAAEFKAKIDTDKDGKISLAEWNAEGTKLFARMDENKDGKIAKDEMPRHHKRQGDDCPEPFQP